MSDLDALETGERDDLASGCVFDLDTLQSFERVQLRGAGPFSRLIGVEWEQRDVVADVYRTALDAADAEATEVRRVIDRRDQHLERTLPIARRRGHVPDDALEERRQIYRRRIEVLRRDAVTRRRVDHRRVELRVLRLALDEEVEHLVVHSHRIGAR